MRHSDPVFLIAAWMALGVPTSTGETLYLLKGVIRPENSSERWPAQLLALDEAAAHLDVVRELGTEKFSGSAFTLVNYEHRVVAIGLPAEKPDTVMVLDMNDAGNPALIKLDFGGVDQLEWEPYPAPLPDGVKFNEAWPSNKATLVFHNSFGLLLGLELFGPKGIAQFGIPIRANSQGRGKGLTRIERNTGFLSSGNFGLGFSSQLTELPAHPYETRLKIGPKNRGEIALSIESPPLADAVRSAGRPMWLYVNDKGAMAISAAFRSPDSTKAGDGSSTLYIRDKQGAKWHRVTVPGDAPAIRSIGKYLLGIAHTQYYKRERDSAGKIEFEEATKNIRYQNSITASGAHSEGYYPGILFVIEVATGKTYQWRTNQADSEVLWADDSAFYYRRINELLRIDLIDTPNGRSLGAPKSIVKSNVLLDVHVAFRGR